jgi:hypothetical protein
VAWWGLWKRADLHRVLLVSSTAFALVLLMTSLSVPMIEIDARIKSVDVQLIGNSVHFNDQVLYYRSKSLMQVVSTLMQTGEADSIGVGVLLLLFSILFPLAKLTSTELLLLGGEGFKKNKLVEFFAFKSGKWSMADVNVVAIFMAFIGFRGILNSQMSGLNLKTEALESITTNATALQPGFFLFTAFVLFSLALSEILKRNVAGGPEKMRLGAPPPSSPRVLVGDLAQGPARQGAGLTSEGARLALLIETTFATEIFDCDCGGRRAHVLLAVVPDRELAALADVQGHQPDGRLVGLDCKVRPEQQDKPPDDRGPHRDTGRGQAEGDRPQRERAPKRPLERVEMISQLGTLMPAG